MDKNDIVKVFLGQTEETAVQLCKIVKSTYRISSRDGIPCVTTRDHHPDRLNFTVVSGKVIGVTFG